MTGEIEASDDVVRANGVVVWRDRSDGRGPSREIDLLVIHRPRYDDWSFAKGKLDPGETDEECADRELLEETGFRCDRTVELTPVDYIDHKGRPKLVRYWLGRLLDGAFEPNDEVDRIEWVDAQTARTMLTYDHDRALVDEAMARLAP